MVAKNQDDWEPHLGHEESTEHVEVRVHTTPDGQRQAMLLPASVRRLNEVQSELVHMAQRKALAAQQLRAELDELALEMRDEGVSWAAIGWSVGLTGEAARKRWADE